MRENTKWFDRLWFDKLYFDKLSIRPERVKRVEGLTIHPEPVEGSILEFRI
jgi:hypothetical protein